VTDSRTAQTPVGEDRPTGATAARPEPAAEEPPTTTVEPGGEETSPGAAPAVGKARVLRWGRMDTVWSLLLVLLAFTITTLGVTRAISLSPFDEASHIDYAWAVSHFNLPFAGSTMAPEVLQEWACRSQEGAQYIIPPCGETVDPADYPVRGENYNYAHPPTYYLFTGFAARALDALPIGVTFVTAARLTGGLWLAIGLVGLYALLRTWRMPRLGAFAAAVLVASAPSIAHASSIVTNDAPGVLTGVLAFWVLTRVVVQERLGWFLPTVIAGFVASVKVIHAVSTLAVAAVVLCMAVAAWRSGEKVRARALGFITVGIVGATALVHFGWRVFQGTRGNPDWVSPIIGINTDPTDGSPVDEWLPTLFSGFGITQTFWLQASLSTFAVIASARLLALLMTVAPFANVATFPKADPRRLLGWVVLVGCGMVPLVVQVQTYLNDGDYFPFVSSRYAISLLPLAVASLAFVAHSRGWRVASWVVTVGCIVALLASFAGLID
jgi:Dolichyl-phosphate-mannose-protein mannosyltransferase